MNALLQHYQNLDQKQGRRLPVFQPGRLLLSSVQCRDHEHLQQTIVAFAPQQGWLCCQSEIFSFTQPPADLAATESSGYLLNGELVNGTRSLHIRQHQEAWLLTSVEYQSSDDECHGLIESARYLNASPDGAPLLYQIFWQHHPKHGLEQNAYRFKGFDSLSANE